jgi:preflagellin peptidase FlaK
MGKRILDQTEWQSSTLIDVFTLDLAGVLASFTFLIYSSWSDIVSREVSDRVWLIFYPVGLVLMSIRLIVQTGSWLVILVSIVSTAVIGLLLPLLGLWGGADGKGFICLALMNPLVPAFSGNLFHIVDPLFPLVVFSNAYVASIASLLYPIQRNLRTFRRHGVFEGMEHERHLHKVAAFLTGYQVSIGELESKPHLFLLESVHRQESTIRRDFEFNPRIDLDRSKELAEIKEAAGSGLLRGGIWVSPGLPFLVFVTLGLAISLLLGDIVWSFVSAVMGALAALI